MKTVLTFIWHFLVVLLVLAVIAAGFGLWQGANFYYGQTEAASRSGGEGPHVFARDGQWVSQTVRGDGARGFWVEEKHHAVADDFAMEIAVPSDGSRFAVRVTPEIATPPVRYQDGRPILAISDIEGNYRTFRDFLVNAKVIDSNLEWTFGNGHLVLLGDFVDRGASVTQVLWLIYKLERAAKTSGGQVHYILGNHEIKSLQGDFQATHEKYLNTSVILGMKQSDLFGDDAFLGRWLASKNTAEVINGVLFVHGGLSPKLDEKPFSLEDINEIVRRNYRRIWYPKRVTGEEELLLDPRTGPSWYRGYFKERLTQSQVEGTLAKFGANAVVVGHTLQSRVKKLFDGKVFAIDVKHPWDHRTGFPPRHSEGLLLEGNDAWRVLEDGSRKEL